MSTCQPDASSASTAATPTSVCMWLLKVSAKRTTLRPPGFAVPPRCANHCWSVSGANVGTRRFCVIPAASLKACANGGVWVTKLTTQGMRVARAEPVLPAVVEELRFVRRHVDVDRAIVRAALAREAEVVRLHHLVRLPAVGDDLPLEHLEQEARAA